jgi:hypothetical protein
MIVYSFLLGMIVPPHQDMELPKRGAIAQRAWRHHDSAALRSSFPGR